MALSADLYNLGGDNVAQSCCQKQKLCETWTDAFFQGPVFLSDLFMILVTLIKIEII